MILVLASRVDDAARDFVAQFPGAEAALLTSRDLSCAGWRISSAGSGSSTAVASGKELAASDITGVLTLVPCIFARELVHIEEADRDYVANEMTSFLLYWLSGLNCTMLNRPSPGCLSGPNWRAEQWFRAAFQLGMPVREFTRSTRARAAPASESTERSVTVTVVGRTCCGTDNEALRRQAISLAGLAGVDLLHAVFIEQDQNYYFGGAHAFADLSSAEVRTAITRHFTARS